MRFIIHYEVLIGRVTCVRIPCMSWAEEKIMFSL